MECVLQGKIVPIKFVTFPGSVAFFAIHNEFFSESKLSSGFIKQNSGLSGNKTSFVEIFQIPMGRDRVNGKIIRKKTSFKIFLIKKSIRIALKDQKFFKLILQIN